MASAVKIPLKVTPNAPKDEVVGWRGDVLAVKITAPPLEGRANRHLLNFLARVFDVSPADVTLLRGETSRTKTVQITGLSATQARERLAPHLQ
ncbi:MAG: YggU family protein [candidate division WS1 bacterium]|jgi:uncharacterized protein (TIGR00251 family)|nr:YggU family protein [candidate division WS1 bacterium]